VVVTEGGGTTVSGAKADFDASATEVATTFTARVAVTTLGAVYVTEVAVWLESVPHAAPAHPPPEMLQVTPWFAGSLKTATVMVADLLSSIVPADEETWKEICGGGGGGGEGALLHPQLHAATSAARSVPTSDPRFSDVMANLFSCPRAESTYPNVAHGRRTLKSKNLAGNYVWTR